MTSLRSWPAPAAAQAAAASRFTTARSAPRRAEMSCGDLTTRCDVQELYKEYLGKPLSERSHHLLHTGIEAWRMPQEL